MPRFMGFYLIFLHESSRNMNMVILNCSVLVETHKREWKVKEGF